MSGGGEQSSYQGESITGKLREFFNGPIISAGGYNRESGNETIEKKTRPTSSHTGDLPFPTPTWPNGLRKKPNSIPTTAPPSTAAPQKVILTTLRFNKSFPSLFLLFRTGTIFRVVDAHQAQALWLGGRTCLLAVF